MKFRWSLLCLFALVLVPAAVVSETARAEKTFLQKWLPALFPDPNAPPGPEETLIAPFEYQKAQPNLGDEPGNAAGLDRIHLNTQEVRRWVEHAISETTTFDNADYQQSFRETQPYFSSAGHQQYADFLRSTGVMQILASNEYFVRSFVEDIPVLLNEGVVDSRYRWLFQVPVTLTYMERSMENYEEYNPVSQQMSITIQVGRSGDAAGEDGIVIETWTGAVKE